MGGPAQFKVFVGYAKVVMRDPTICGGRGCTLRLNRDIEFWDRGLPTTSVDVINYANLDKWTVVHEFGHAWDRNLNWQLAEKLEQYTKGHTSLLEKIGLSNCDTDQRLPGCNNAGYFYSGPPSTGSGSGFDKVEDFAESVTAAVYPTQAQSKVQKYLGHKLYSGLYYADYTKTTRWSFINGLINGTIHP
jgi:hypothetical protein